MIIFVRHGQTTTNAKGLLVGRSDPELTELGQRQARALRPLLQNVSEVWVSPLQRARFTAELAVPHVSSSVRASFVEVDYGDLEGQPMSAISPAQWRAFEADHTMALGNGESLASVDARVHAELDTLLANRAAQPRASLGDCEPRVAHQVGNGVGTRRTRVGGVALEVG